MILKNTYLIKMNVILQGQFYCHACSVNANWLHQDSWIRERCLYSANFRICALVIARFHRPMCRYEFGWRAILSDLTLLLLRGFLWCEVSQNAALATQQNWP